MKQQRNQHEWGVVAQCKKPYREFAYCPLCNQYRENKLLMSRKKFKELSLNLRTTNPMYEPDSNLLFGIEGEAKK